MDRCAPVEALVPLFALTIFAGAFLLFLAEPLVAKMLLPLFGGAAAVWIAALLFFQTGLLGGYAYADWLVRKLSPRAQALVHTAVLGAGLLVLPLAPAERVRALLSSWSPTAQVLAVLVATIGLPYLALSATGPLVQAFWARAHRGSPYRLYALSNLGSMLGLLAYPAVVEPFLGLRAQSIVWSAAFALFAVLCGTLALRSAKHAPPAPAETAEAAPLPSLRDRAWWIALPLLSAVLLSAVTIDLTLNVAPIPLLWVLPLAAYLLSFILCFESDRIYRRALFVPALVVALGFLAWRTRSPLRGDHVAWEIGSSIAAFFVCSMALHGELVRIKPRPAHLTKFYLAIALGGALGGAFVAVGAPVLFRTDLELAAGVLGTALAMAALLWPARPMLGPLSSRRAMQAALALGLVLLAGKLVIAEALVRKVAVDYARGFYGPVRIEDEPSAMPGGGKLRKLVHGATVHGTQRLAPGRLGEPTGYYGPESGIAMALDALHEDGEPLRVGVIGLGAGVLATYCLEGDQFTFYEIDPLIDRVARQHFQFLGHCKTDVILGDARLTLAERVPQAYDLLILDAFSGDAVPVHLLTSEAFAMFARHVKPGGIISLHVSNRFLDLEPVVAAAADRLGRVAYLVDDEGDLDRDLYGTRWTFIVESPQGLERLGLESGEAQVLKTPASFRAWTDDYSNLVALLR